jgi:AraC-like DNA-binding protein/mannose-6-phosphate isomerase-like protein (cupin superfamily)
MRIEYETHQYPNDFNVDVRLFNERNAFISHWHSDYEMLMVVDGKVDVGVNSRIYTLMQGDIAVIINGDIHYIQPDQEHAKYYCVLFPSQIIESLLNVVFSPIITYPIINRSTLQERSIPDKQLSILHDSFEFLYWERTKMEPYYQLAIMSKLAEMIGLLLRYFSSQEKKSNEMNEQSNTNLHLIKKVIRYIEQNYDQSLSLHNIADQFNISSYYLSRLFHKTVGITFKAYMDIVRVGMAKKFIESSDESITEIAHSCGFQSIRTFNRRFKQINCMTPSALRKK